MKGLLFLSLCLCASISSFSQISPPVINIINDYKARIIQHGGSISNTDISAVTDFVTNAKNHQYWDKLLDVGPLAGDDLDAARVKLKFPANDPSFIEQAGFSAADYTADQGLQLSTSASLNTKTNLSTLNLQGLFGLSIWLTNGAYSWIGSPNNNTPYSILVASPTSVSSYIGNAGGSGNVLPSEDAFYHVIKQSLTSTKVFVAGNQNGSTNAVLNTAQLRDADVEVFKEAYTGGKGMFYCIDDGTMSDNEAGLFYTDVRQLMYDLGRIIAPPSISADGLYNTTQTVTLTEKPTASSMAGATIYYTTDGSLPTTNSPVYTSPLTVSSTQQVQAIAVKSGKTSKPANAWVAIVPVGFNTDKYYTAHVMINLLAFANDMTEWVRTMKASGYNLIWAHLDDYTNNGQYVITLERLMNAADSVGGIQVMPGASWWVTPSLVTQMFQDTWNHPSLFKIGGKRVYTNWDYQADNQHIVDSLLLQSGITTDQYYLWSHSRYPYTYNGGNTWVGEYALPNGYLTWNGNGAAGQAIDIDHLYKTRPQLDGLINFAVDQGGKAKTILTNKLIAQSSIQKGRFSMGGVNAFYASASYNDYGFGGAAEIWDSILALPIGSRPSAMSDITANDYAELSYMSPMVLPAVNGLSFIPALTAGFTLGNNVRYPLTDHGGIQKFLRPWVEAFLHNQPAPAFTEDRMFAWYWLHPKDQQPTSVIPSIFNGYGHLNQQWWNNTIYASGYIDVGGSNQVEGIKYHFANEMGKIRMAAHLTAPARLKINNTLSDIKPAGAAYFEIEMGSFRGTPTFSIVREGVDVKSGAGLQPITDNVFPGGWNFLATEITSSIAAAAVTHHYQTKSSGNWSNLSTWQSSADNSVWQDATAIPSSSVNTITIRNGHTVMITDTLTVDQLYIKNGGVLNVLPNASVIIKDGVGDDITIEATGKMVIQSDVTGTGRIGNSSGNIAGNVTVEQYISSGNNKPYRLLSPSVNTANGTKPFIRDNWQEGQNNTNSINNNAIAHYGTHITGSSTGANGFDATGAASPSLFNFNTVAAGPAWLPVANTNAINLEVKKGYLIYIRGDRSCNLVTNSTSPNTTLRATGTIAVGTQHFSNQAGDGQISLVTNPYACPVNWNAIYNDATLSNHVTFENFYHYWDPTVGTSGGYVTVNVNGIKSVATNATIEIPSGQAFFIKARPGIVLPTFTVKESHKVNLPIGQPELPPIQQEHLMTSLYFTTADGTNILADGVNTVFDNAFSTTVDENDAEEIANTDENIAIIRDGKLLSIEGRPKIGTTDTLPLIIQRLGIKSYRWQFNPESFTSMNQQAYLEDHYLHLSTPISLTAVTVIPFSVNADTASAAADRFRIVFAAPMILPVTMRSLKAYQLGAGIQVEWVTEYERNMDRYEVEKSTNGQQFTKAGTVYAHLSGSLTNTYTWFDANPMDGNNYYRIKETDKTGTVHYSGIAKVKTGDKKESFEVFPNPLTGNFVTVQLNNISKGIYTVNLLNANGQKLFSKMIDHPGGSASQMITFNADFPAGNYYLQISGNGTSVIKQLVK